MANDDDLRAAVVAAAEDAGELFWPMPLPDELRKGLDSPVADIANIGERFGGMLSAGVFLREFVKDELPWAHLDIAGPSYNEGSPHGHTPQGRHGGRGPHAGPLRRDAGRRLGGNPADETPAIPQSGDCQTLATCRSQD